MTALEQFSLAGKHIIVTGGGRGLGRGIALAVAAAGAHTTIMARSDDELAVTVELAGATNPGSCHAHSADLTDIEGLRDHVDDIDRQRPIDGIVHAAGVQRRVPAADVTVEDWRFVQSVNADAVFFLTQEIARRQLE